MNKKWFKRKLYGWGWVPATWQGWVVIAVFTAVIAVNSIRVESQLNRGEGIGEFAIVTSLLVIVLIGVCYLTGEKPRWQWGEKKGNKN